MFPLASSPKRPNYSIGSRHYCIIFMERPNFGADFTLKQSNAKSLSGYIQNFKPSNASLTWEQERSTDKIKVELGSAIHHKNGVAISPVASIF